MSRNSLKAIDLYCAVINWNNSLANAYPSEIKRWTAQRDRKLAAFRKVMAKVTLDDFLSGRWGSCPLHQRLAEWADMQAMASGWPFCELPHRVPTRVRGNLDVHLCLGISDAKGGVGGVCPEGHHEGHPEEMPEQ
jgi:hypothetical protein